MKDNQEACSDLVEHIGKLMSQSYSIPQSCRSADIGLKLRDDIKRLQECVFCRVIIGFVFSRRILSASRSMQAVQNILQHTADRTSLVRGLKSASDVGKIAERKEIIDRLLTAFKVRLLRLRLLHHCHARTEPTAE